MKRLVAPLLLLTVVLLYAGDAQAQTLDLDKLLPGAGSSVSGRMIQIFAVLTVLSVAPGLLIMVTSFTRFVVALSFLRSGIGLQSTPSNIILISLALFMTFYVMTPTFDRAWENGVRPLMENSITEQEAMVRISTPFREFMLAQVREKDLKLFSELAREKFKVNSEDVVDFRILIPAFMISELRRLSHRHSIFGHRYDRGHAHHVDGHDDDAALGDRLAGESPVLRPDRRLEHACGQPGPIGRIKNFPERGRRAGSALRTY